MNSNNQSASERLQAFANNVAAEVGNHEQTDNEKKLFAMPFSRITLEFYHDSIKSVFTLAEYRLYLFYSFNVNRDTGKIRKLRKKDIADCCDISTRNIRRYTTTLIEKGYCEKNQKELFLTIYVKENQPVDKCKLSFTDITEDDFKKIVKKDLTCSALKLLLHLLLTVDKETNIAKIPHKNDATEICGFSERSYWRSIQELEAGNFIEVEEFTAKIIM